MDKLTELIERVEAGDGEDRELDGAIECAARWAMAAHVGLAPEYRARWESDHSGWVRSHGSIYIAESFTTSLDATLALVERVLPGWSWMLRGGWAKVWRPGSAPPGNDFNGSAKTPARALLAATLRALHHGGTG